MAGRKFPEWAERKDIIIVGTGDNAEMAFEYFTKDTFHRVWAFSVEKQFIDGDRKRGLPVVPFEDVQDIYPPDKYAAFVAVGYMKLNHVRARLFEETKAKGYELVSYISKNAFVWDTVKIGENCFILEDNVIQHGAEIGDNAWLWSGNHVGHFAKIGRHVFVASHVVISGSCEIRDYTFCGVNSTFANDITIGSNCVIGMGADVTNDIGDGLVVTPARPEIRELSGLPAKARAHFHPEG